MSSFAESVVEEAALAWLESLGWPIKHGPEIGPRELFAGRQDYGPVALEGRLHDTLPRLNPALPPEALDDAFRRMTRPEGVNPETRNRTIHRWLLDGVTVEYRRDCLHQPMASHGLVDVHRVERRCIEAGKPHVLHENGLLPLQQSLCRNRSKSRKSGLYAIQKSPGPGQDESVPMRRDRSSAIRSVSSISSGRRRCCRLSGFRHNSKAKKAPLQWQRNEKGPRARATD